MAAGLRTDVHLYPLYLKFAADQFQRNNEVEGLRFFEQAEAAPHSYKYKVYEQMWKVHNKQSKIPLTHKDDFDYGRKAFHGFDGLSSTAQEKAMAIELLMTNTQFSQAFDKDELARREAKVHECLWRLHGEPQGDLEYGNHAFNGLHGRIATIEQKFAAVMMYADRSRVCTLSSDRCEMHLIKREDGKLELQTVYPEHMTLRAINSSTQSSQEQIESFSKYSVMIIDNGTPRPEGFFDCPFFPETYLFGRKQIKLQINQQGMAVWRMYDPDSKRITCCNVNPDDFQTLEGLRQLPQNQWESVPLDFKADIFLNERSLHSVSLVKKTHQSQMDPSKTVDRDNWAVTLISHGLCSGFDLKFLEEKGIDTRLIGIDHVSFDPGFGHAMIVWEGIEKGAHFIKRAHLTTRETPSGYAQIQEDNFHVDSARIRAKSKTWLRPRSFVKRMTELIQRDKQEYVLFNLTGNPDHSEHRFSLIFTQFPKSLELVAYDFGDYTLDSLENCWDLFINCSPRKETIERQHQRKEWRALRYAKTFGFIDAGKNCLTWTKKPLLEAGIELPEIDSFVNSPDAYIQWIANNPSLVKLRE